MHALAAAFGLSALFLALPAAYDAVRYAGAAWLIYLAYIAIRADVPVPNATPTRAPAARVFRQGLVTNVLNPKMALFVIALFPQFLKPEEGFVALQILLLATILNTIGLVVKGCVILTAGRLSQKFGRGRFGRAPRSLPGAVFAGLAARLAFDGRR